jgi:hypothetical protein
MCFSIVFIEDETFKPCWHALFVAEEVNDVLDVSIALGRDLSLVLLFFGLQSSLFGLSSSQGIKAKESNLQLPISKRDRTLFLSLITVNSWRIVDGVVSPSEKAAEANVESNPPLVLEDTCEFRMDGVAAFLNSNPQKRT